jgi:hypothetical protein
MQKVDLYELFGAETLQDDEQAQADGWATIAGLCLACFGAGALATVAVALVLWRFM